MLVQDSSLHGPVRIFSHALLACVPLFYGSLIAGVSVPLAYYFVLGLFVLGRESLIDAHQADADRKAGFRTLAILLGRPATSS
jgi:4-hydroxybenzoate polyprenyltransferase